MFSVGSAALARASGALSTFAQDGSKRLKKAQKGAKGLKKALEKPVRACPVPPVRSKRLFEPASVPPVRSKRLFETALRDHYSKVLGSATLCSEPLYSALLCSVHVYARVHTSIYIYIYIYARASSANYFRFISSKLVCGPCSCGTMICVNGGLLSQTFLRAMASSAL